MTTHRDDEGAVRRTVEVHTAAASLTGDLVVPPRARGVVLFAHGSGSSRHSPRNQQVAAGLQDAGFGTLLMDRPDRTRAVISRGGRPDLAEESLDRVRSPALLIVGGADRQVLALNRAAAARLAGENDVAVVPGATHLFPEPGALEQVIDRSVEWLDTWLPPAPDC